MEFFALVGVLVAIVRFAARKRVKPETLCVDCVWSHIQWGTMAERDLHCSFGNFLRPVRMNVLHCTHFRARSGSGRERPQIGFVQIQAAQPVTINQTGASS